MSLYIVATPIGNLKDITLRALEVLKEVDFIACEDTRHTKILLNHFGIEKPLISYFQHSKITKINKLIEIIGEGKSIALVTDAGTPGISDPGGRLVDQVISELGNKVEVIGIPGANAAVMALSISGFNTDEFVFYGFLPHKKGRQTKLKEIGKEEKLAVLYESPYRIKKLLAEIVEFVGDREVVVCRELTKKFEEVYRGKASEVKDKIKEKGEFVIVIKGHEKTANNALNNTKTKSQEIVIKGHEKTTNNTLKTTESREHKEATNNSLKATKEDGKNKVDLLYPELGYLIRGIALKIRGDYGSGQKESVYQRAFAEELEIAQTQFEKEAVIKILSKNTGKSIGVYKPDFVVDNKIILELKAANFLPVNQESQLFDYLKNSKYELGYIVNFGGKKLYCKRVIYTNDRKDFGVN